MNVEYTSLKIEFESEEEIKDFWNVVMFALDLHSERQKEGRSCMTESELALANKLETITHKTWEH